MHANELIELRKNIQSFFNTKVLKYNYDRVLEFGAMTCVEDCAIPEYYFDTKKELEMRGSEYHRCDPFMNNFKNSFMGDMTIWNEEFEKRKNSYDAIIAFECLEHSKEFWKTPEIFYNLLKPNGKLFITVPFYFFIHHHNNYKDYWRFTDEGLNLLYSKYFDCNIKFLNNENSRPISITLIGERKNG